MKIKLEENGIFDCPQGQWPGVCVGIDEPKQRINRLCIKQVRLRFSVEVDDEEYIVAKTFCAEMRPRTELHSYLASWCDEDFDRYTDDHGQIDLELFIGRKADLFITHGPKTNEYRHPFVNISGIFPRGRLTED